MSKVKWRWIMAICVLLLFAVACGGSSPGPLQDTDANAGSSLRYVWVQTYNQSMAEWRHAAASTPVWVFFAVLIGGTLVAVGMTIFSQETWVIMPAMVVVILLSFGLSSMNRSGIVERAPKEVTAAADTAAEQGIEKKKQEVAFRYAELLNYQFTQILPDSTVDVTQNSNVIKICNDAMDSRTNCWPYEHEYYHHSTYSCDQWDDDGNCTHEDEDRHYKHDPIVKYMIRWAGVANLPDKYATPETGLFVRANHPDQPLYFFSDWMIPPDYTNHYWSGHRETYSVEHYAIPIDLVVYLDLITNGLPMGVTSWHRYSNPLLATANADFVGDPAVLERLRAANMLLTPRDLYSPGNGPTRTFYDFIYPLGSMNCAPDADWQGFTDDAQAVNMYYGNLLHISNSFAFACESDMEAVGVTIDDLIYNLKADMYNEDKWNRVFGAETLYTIMQQNTILVVCGVAEATDGPFIRPAGCRVMTGLPIGNETLKEAFASGLPDELQNMQFTPEGLFGNPMVIEAADGRLIMSGTEGTPMYLWEVYGAKKPSMGDNFAYLIDRIELTPDEINQVITAAVAQQRAVTQALDDWPKIMIWAELALILMGLFGYFNNK